MVISSLKLVEPDLLRVEEQLVTLLEKRGGVLKGPAEMMFRGGGKRLRPALVLLSSRLFGPQPESAISIAAAVEMVHGASLIHDDVIDNTDVRRGQPTMKALSGNRIAVLLGDLLLCQALLAVAELDRVVLVQVVSQAVADMTAGQILELRQQGNVETQVDDYLRMIEGKTAALMEAGCRLGALLTGATPAQVEACGQFGLNLGMAFQISDDVLDIWGNPDKLGKPTGSDLRERKYTLPFLYAYQQSLKPQRNLVRQLLTQDTLEPGAMQALVQWMDQNHSREHAIELAEKYIRQARAALRQTPAGPTRTTLEELLDYVVNREH
ncbi:MAG: polyprenyl synthetase family protein [Candidatus Eremiobacteraeota bacterium]|nr:polyprenyl synthetase family protein [Candidatus Eremiobacteraeota bacterium]MCW5866473.1 polyprenyl synthetase family protein [Candidatus Eremiobacteraeota bacterium]